MTLGLRLYLSRERLQVKFGALIFGAKAPACFTTLFALADAGRQLPALPTYAILALC